MTALGWFVVGLNVGAGSMGLAIVYFVARWCPKDAAAVLFQMAERAARRAERTP